MNKTLREQLADYDRDLQSGRLDMRRRLADHEPAGLRDMRNLYRVHQAEETGAMRIIGWLFTVLFGAGLGVCVALWWLGAI